MITRLILTALLLIGVYKETGPFTVLAIALITVALELNNKFNDEILKLLKEIP